MSDEKDIELMTVKELKVALKSRKMPVKGSKEELVDRLRMALEGDTEDSDDAVSESGSEGKTPRSNSPSTKLTEKGALALDADNDVHDFAPVSEKDVEEPPSLERIKTDEDMSKGDASEKARTATPVKGNAVVPEWRNLHIPDDWLPMPLIRVSNLPSDVELEALRSLLEKSGRVKVAHLTFETSKPGGRSSTALIRLRAPKEELIAETQSEDGTKAEECDVRAMADEVVKNLRTLDIDMNQRKLEFEAPLCRTTLFVHNLEEYYGNKDDRFRAEMTKVGEVIRCFIVRNKLGESKDYGFVEYLSPYDAMTAKEILDKKSADALSEFKKQRNSSTSGAAMVPLKRLRCEWAFNPNISSLYSKICYISNLPPNFEDREVLRNVFAPHGTVLSCNIRTRPGMGPGCGFVDFERGEDAEKALRALDGSRDTPLGFILVSFVNPGKFPGDVQPPTVAPYQRGPFPKRPRDLPGGNGNHPGGYGLHNRHAFSQPGRPPFDMQHRGRVLQRPSRGRSYRNAFPPAYGGYNQSMYAPYYGSYNPGFMPQYVGNGGYNQFPPQAPGGYPPGAYGGATGYGNYRGTPSVPTVKAATYGEPDYPPHDTYSGGGGGGVMGYNGGGSNYTAASGSHPPSGGGSYGQGLNQSGYPSSYGTGYQSGYGQSSVTGYTQPGGGGGGFAQQGSYGQAGYGGGGSVHGGQMPGSKREHDYEASSYGTGHYGKKPRY